MNKRIKKKKLSPPKMLILRCDLNRMRTFKKYIIGCSDGLVFDVYNHTIYFLKSQANELGWQNMEGHYMSRQTEDRILAAINALCKTRFVFKN